MSIKTLIAVVIALAMATVASAKEIIVTATAYCYDNNTASGEKPSIGIIAISRDLLKEGWAFGDTVEIEGLGCFVIKDLMHKRKRRAVDIYVKTRKQAKDFGRKEAKAKKKEGKEKKKDTNASGTAWNDRPGNWRQGSGKGERR